MLFQDPDAPLDERIDDLLGRLTIEEKCSQLRFDSPAIERLGITPYNWWNEALHGVGRNGRATVFPEPIGLAASWDARLVESVASSIADEARAKHHEAARKGSYRQSQGLTFWTPNINIFRDPRWGRGMETWGEDPFLTGELGTAFVRGLQGDDPKYYKTTACAKHFAVHSGPEGERHGFDACPPKEDFWNTYLPAFERLVEEGVESVMPAYNRTYGEACAGSHLLLQDILRGRWGFQGHVVSDCWAIQDFHTKHGVTKTVEESAALALKSGTDLNCGTAYCEALQDALRLGLVTEADVDTALRRLLRCRFRLGMFDPAERVPYAATPMSVVRCEKHRKLAVHAAAETFVLLKNRDQTLPLPAQPASMLIIGPNASNVDVMLGNYYGLSDRITTVLEGITGRLPEGVEIDYRPGTMLDQEKRNPVDWSTFEASRREYVIAAMGISPLLEGEEGDAIMTPFYGDRERIELPQNQIDYLAAIRTRIDESGTGAKLIVLLFSGSPLAIPEVHDYADAILQVWYPGEAGGEAIASVLWGDHPPGGRMPLTVPRCTDVLPAFNDYAMAGRGYRGMDEADVLYPFGYGLGYSQVSYRDLKAPERHAASEPLTVRVTLENKGAHAVKEIAQVYVSKSGYAPKLVGFATRGLPVGASETVEISIPPRALIDYTSDGAPTPLQGDVTLTVSACAPGKRAQELGAPEPISATLTLT
ncbi:MAG: glycoside hydrolase family 3 N-terminal domain-containing protein [Opitutales bacterium]